MRIYRVANRQIDYQLEEDDGGIAVSAYLNGDKIGFVTADILFDPYEHEFNDVLSEDEFEELYPENEIVKIEWIEVDDKYKHQGVATMLMVKLMQHLKDTYSQFYLNASPIGNSGLQLNDLVNFYKNFGFNVIKTQGHNVLMGF